MILFYLLTFFITGLYVLLMLSYLYGWKKTTPLSQRRGVGGEAIFCTIILPARNEAQNILNCLASISKQQYPLEQFEVIVVDDHSDDKTAEIAASDKYSNVKIIQLEGHKEGKKAAIAEGIKNANGKLDRKSVV